MEISGVIPDKFIEEIDALLMDRGANFTKV